MGDKDKEKVENGAQSGEVVTEGKGLLGELEDLFNDGKQALDVVKDAWAGGRADPRAKALSPEPMDITDFAPRFRRLVEHASAEGGLTWRVESGQVRVELGEGRHMRLYQGPTACSALDAAYHGERLE